MRENTWLVKSVGYYLKTVIINNDSTVQAYYVQTSFNDYFSVEIINFYDLLYF